MNKKIKKSLIRFPKVEKIYIAKEVFKDLQEIQKRMKIKDTEEMFNLAVNLFLIMDYTVQSNGEVVFKMGDNAIILTMKKKIKNVFRRKDR